MLGVQLQVNASHIPLDHYNRQDDCEERERDVTPQWPDDGLKKIKERADCKRESEGNLTSLAHLPGG
jgi:hypothetical protein